MTNHHPGAKHLPFATTITVLSLFIASTSSLTLMPTPVSKFALPKNLRGVLFDIDGTLADSWKLGFDATQVVLEQNGVPSITEKCYHEHCIYTTPERLARHAGLIPGEDDNFEEVGNRLGNEFDNMYVNLVSTETAGFYPGIMDLLNELPNDVKLGALTNACVAYAHAVLESNCDSDVHSRFLAINGADNVPKAKPNPDGLLLCCEQMGVDPNECVYIGDSPSDGKAAHNAG